MKKRMAVLAESFENNTLGLDDTFKFKCRTCGKCCKNRHDIMLSTRDLHNIANSLGRTMQYVVERYCDVYIGESSRIPIVRLHPNSSEQACPFLRNRRCIVHNAKPVVCALFPLGRGIKMPMADKYAVTLEKIQPEYIFQPVSCGSQDQIHTVRNWLEQFGIPVEDEFYVLWTQTITVLSVTFCKLEDMEIPDSSKELLWDFVFSALYISYDAGKDLMSQFRDNTDKLMEIFNKIYLNEITGGI